MKLHSLIMLFFLTIFSSCKENSPTQPPDDLIFPLQVGNRWEYSRALTTFNIRGHIPDSLGLSDTTITSSSSLEIVRMDTLPNSIETFVFHETVTSDNFVREGEAHYNNQADGLFMYAFSGGNSTLLKSIGSRIFNNINYVRSITSYINNVFVNQASDQDSLIIIDSPFKSLQYPLQVGMQWTYGNGSVTKKVVGTERIQVPAGTFDCFKIQWMPSLFTEIEFTDYVSASGLIKRVTVFKDQVITGPDGPEPLGFIDIQEEAELGNFQLK